ncbi:MAG: hypothetical protein WCB99_12330, partial [Candidatus Cybelea sp.]
GEVNLSSGGAQMAQPVPSALVEAARCGSGLEIERLLQAVWPVAHRLASVLGDREAAQESRVIR